MLGVIPDTGRVEVDSPQPWVLAYWTEKELSFQEQREDKQPLLLAQTSGPDAFSQQNIYFKSGKFQDLLFYLYKITSF